MKLNQGFIEFKPTSKAMEWTISFEIPRFKILDKRFKTWIFHQSGRVEASIDLPTVSLYRAALIAMRKQLDEWIHILDKAVEFEKEEKHGTQH